MLFRNLQPDEIAAIIAHLRSASFTRGSRIMERGVWHGLLYIIASGQVSVLLQEEAENAQSTSQAATNGTLAVASLGPGECFGEMSLITGEPPSATIRAEEDTQLWALPQADFLTLVGSCPTLLSNINTILSLRLARTNQKILLNHAAERIWLSLLDDAASPIQRSLVVHVASTLAARSQKRVLLLECCDQHEAVGPHFATHSGQLRPSLAACAREHSLLQAHRTPPMTADETYYPALSALTDLDAPVGFDSTRGLEAAVNTLSCLPDLAHCYEYILLVTTPNTPPDLIQAISHVCTRSLALVPASLASTHSIEALPTAPTAIFVTHVPEHPTIGQQDHYSSLLGAPVTRLLTADLPLLEQCWEQQAPLCKIASDATLTNAVDFLARYIAHQTVGIAFGGGGARGFAHLGVLENLLEHGVPIDYIAACSSGIITPGMYLIGKSFAESEEIFLQIQRHIVRWHLPRTSIFSNKGLKHMLRSLCGELRFEDLSTPFAMVAVDLATRAGVVLDRGPLWQASLASVSLPGIFPPVTVGEHILMDAGMHDPVPIRLVRKMGADILLASELSGQEPPSLESATPWLAEPALSRKHIRSPHIIDLLLRSYDLAMATIGMHSSREADVVIRPKLHRISLRQFSEGRKFVTTGREAAEQSLPSLRQFLPWIV
ncbi:MAG: patatin-like phospholipase family protein, partial [Ktedonobacteraceae bacterium]